MTQNTADFPSDLYFKYMSRDAAKAVLNNHTLRWSTPERFNDPFDVKFDLHLNVDRKSIKQAALNNLWNAFYSEAQPVIGNFLGALVSFSRGKVAQLTREEFDDYFGGAIDEGWARIERILPDSVAQIRKELIRSKILCLTKNPNEILMWSHYAERHQGLVLGFRTVPELDSPWPVGRAVEYLDEIPPMIDEQTLIEMFSGQKNLDPSDLLNRLVFTKSIQWSYEKEWRLFSGDGRNKEAPFEDISFGPPELSAVVLGCYMPGNSQKEFYDQVSRLYPHTTVFRAVKTPGAFQLSIVPYRN